MTFLHPGYFLALLGLLPLVAVYLLKVRPKRFAVTALFLWDAVFDQKRQSALFRRLRNWLSLLLMILAWMAVVLALCAPELAHDKNKDLLLIIDNSASMQARDPGGTRLEAAKQNAIEIIQGLHANQQAAVATVSLDLQYQSHFTDSPQTLLEAVQKITPSDGPLRAEALAMLDPNTLAIANCRILLFSDGCHYRADANSPIELIKIGTDQGNIGFIACDLRLLHPRPVQAGFYYQLASSFAEPVTTDIVIRHGPEARIVKVVTATVKPGINPAAIVTVENGGFGHWQADLDIEDALSVDNKAYMTLPPEPPISVHVESENGFFLVHSVLAFAKTSGDLNYVEAPGDVALAAGGVVPQAPRSILFGVPETSGWWGQVGPEVDDVLARARLADHPVLQNCDLDAVAFVGARDISLPAESLVLVETAQHVPLVYRVRNDQQSAMVFNMDPWDSDFYYSAWFPVLVYNGARHLMSREDVMDSAYPLGATVTLPITDSGREPTLVRVGGREELLTVTGSAYGPLREIGFHVWVNQAGTGSLGANLFSTPETLLNNRDVVDTSAPLGRGRPLSAPLTLTAVLLLLVECALYHRRKVG